MSEVHQYYLIDSAEVEKLKTPPFISYSDTYQAITKTQEELDKEKRTLTPKLKLKAWVLW
jgi:hypothetical protein